VVAVALAAPFALVTLGLVVVVAACVVREDHGLRGLLCLRPVAYMGRISYGIYLCHLIVAAILATAVGHLLSPVSWFVLTLICTMWVAVVSFTFFETPFLRRKSRYSRLSQPDVDANRAQTQNVSLRC
jgi:peptidoglycan/LPS O-acetylase OafA/YrhL